jgi:hypothetical protein
VALDLPISGFESAKLKLARAAVHLQEISELIGRAAQGANAYELVKDGNGKETISFLIGPPRDVLVIVGEIVYQLRSALDHLAFHLVQSNPSKIALPTNWERNCQFPLYLSVPTCGNPQIPYNIPVPIDVFERNLPGISKAAYSFIEGIQPYRPGPGVHNILRVIAQLANIDKHRHLHVILPNVAVRYDVAYSDGISGSSVVGGLKHGAEIPLPDELSGNPAVQVKRSFSPYITFDETIGAGPDTLESQNILQICLGTIDGIIIPAFDKLLQNP